MVALEGYIKDGKVSRTGIALAIKYGDLCRDDVDDIVKCDQVKQEFFNVGQTKKVQKTEWTKDYLDTLVFASVAEVFDSEYLYYLCDVAEYVNGKGKKQKVNFAINSHKRIYIALAVVACALVCIKIAFKN